MYMSSMADVPGAPGVAKESNALPAWGQSTELLPLICHLMNPVKESAPSMRIERRNAYSTPFVVRVAHIDDKL